MRSQVLYRAAQGLRGIEVVLARPIVPRAVVILMQHEDDSPGQQGQGPPQIGPAAGSPGLQCATAGCETWPPTAGSPPPRSAA